MTPACPNTDPPSSSSIPHRTKSSNPPSATKNTPNKNQFHRKPLRDLKLSNSSHGSSSSSSRSSMSTSLSNEAPKECLRFFNSHSSSMKTPLNRCMKTPHTTPKSAPNANASKHYPKSRHMISKEKSSRTNISEKFKKNPSSRYQSGRKPIPKATPTPTPTPTPKPTFSFPCSVSRVRKFTSGEVELNSERRVEDSSDKTYTPLTKLSIGSCLDGRVSDKIINDERSNTSSNKTKTPPVQASVSPEIQCGSSLFSSATPACYAAGYVVSGVTDKRKCRPRGILTVGDNDLEFGIAKALNDFDNDDEGIDIKSSTVSMLPLPAEASMHWHLSPCNEVEDYNSDDCSWKFRSFDGCEASQSPSTLSDHQFTSDICMMSGSSIDINSNGRKKNTCMVFPSEVNDFEGFVSPVYDNSTVICSPCATTATLKDLDPDEDRKYGCSTEDVNSPFSMDTLGSENVIQTPESESRSERYAGMSWSNGDDHLKHDCDPELNSVVKKLQMTSLSPKSHVSVRGPSSSSFEFDTLTAPSSSIDTSQFQKSLGNPDSWISKSVRDDMSQSHMKISWREKSVSRVFEMDEFDNCRCFSDEEEDDNGRSKDQLKSSPSFENSVDAENQPISTNASTDFLDKISATEAKDRGSLPPFVPCTCAESISTDGGGLDRSEDSDWTLCYKDQSFQVMNRLIRESTGLRIYGKYQLRLEENKKLYGDVSSCIGLLYSFPRHTSRAT